MSDYKLQTKSIKIPFYKQRPRTSILLDILSVLFLCGGGIGMLTGIAMAAYDRGDCDSIYHCRRIICLDSSYPCRRDLRSGGIEELPDSHLSEAGKAGLNFRTAKNLSHLSSVR